MGYDCYAGANLLLSLQLHWRIYPVAQFLIVNRIMNLILRYGIPYIDIYCFHFCRRGTYVEQCIYT
jgi:hypothetical protein